jgi:hypothetical protein
MSQTTISRIRSRNLQRLGQIRKEVVALTLRNVNPTAVVLGIRLIMRSRCKSRVRPLALVADQDQESIDRYQERSFSSQR